MENADAVFDLVMESIDDDGKFQKQFSFIYNFIFMIISGMPYSSLILALATPDHWCHVPGRNVTNYTHEQWRDLHTPQSACTIYNASTLQSGVNDSKADYVTCEYGYEYDLTWYISTIPSTQDWVCDKELFTTNIFSASTLGEVAGALILGQLGDYIGRKPVYIAANVLSISGRILGIFVVGNYYAFIFATVLASFASLTSSQSTLAISMEMTKPGRRAHLAQIQNYGWCLSMVLLALICWAYPEWKVFTVITTLPLVYFVLTSKSLIESPRWLAGRGRMAECFKELKNIAKTNGRVLQDDMIEKLRVSSSTPEAFYGVMGTVSSWRLAKNTFAMTFALIVFTLCYGVIMLNTTHLRGNPFLQFIWQSVIEVPGYILGKFLCDKIGRRLTGSCSSLLSTMMFIPVVMTVRDSNAVFLTSSFQLLAKFGISVTYYTQTLQTMEIYPTCLRQTGMSLAIVVSGLFGVFVPYIVYLGTAYDARYPYIIMLILCMSAAIVQLFLPETLNVKLPETLDEAREFGKGQKFFSLPGSLRGKPNIEEEDATFI